MNTNNYFPAIFLLTVFASCSSSDEEILENDSVRKFRQLNITQIEGDDATRSLFDLTRASLIEDIENKKLSASWTKEDKLTYCNLSDAETLNETIVSISGTLEAESTSKQSIFSGLTYCTANDHLALIYPAGFFEYSSIKIKDNYNVYHNTVKCTLNLSNQDGTLGKIAKNYYYLYGDVKIVSADNYTASGEVTMVNMLTVCKFSFVDINNQTSLIPIKKLMIKYNDQNDFLGKYPVTSTLIAYPGYHELRPNLSDDVLEVITPTNDNTPTEVYVALLPTDGSEFHFTVVNDLGIYEGTAEATLKAGKFVLGPKLKLTKTN